MKLKCFFLLCIFFYSITTVSADPNFYDDIDNELLIEKIIHAMSAENKIGQVLMLGFMGDEPSEEIMKWVRDRQIGGIKIFGWNANDLSILATTINTMQIAAANTTFSIPLLIATDQEGGWVRHVRGDMSITPGNMALGAADNLYDAWKTGYFIGLELKTLGINMNFAPVVDIYLNPKADVIGPRAFSDDPVKTAMLGLSFFKGMDSTGVISTAKHFPGHGDTDKDSHGTLPQLNVTMEQLNMIDLIPYKILISEKIPAIMVGHLAFPEITNALEPASLSYFFNTELLQREMSFEGLIISDDLFMYGARSDGLPLPQVCEKGLRAGLSLLLVSRNPNEHEKIWNYLISLMKIDENFVHIVNEAVRKVLRTKISYLKTSGSVPLYPDNEQLKKNIPAQGSGDFFLQQSLRSVSLLKAKGIPLDNELKYLLAGSFSSFFYEGRERLAKSDFHRFSYSPDSDEIQESADFILNNAHKYDYIIFNLHNVKSLYILKKLESIKDKLIVFSVLTPVYMAEVPWVQTAIAVYGTGEDSFKAGFSVLSGDYSPDSIVPVYIEGFSY
ncbi:MAG: glycoside hydrolase family 3 protein [Spirochaetaceae bacterium]|nr:glycoside hydrolase family 3 protein [Spirochaetaceae bacterium]